MKYLIQDTEDYTLGEINGYFREELKQTNLNKDDIIVESSLRIKVALMELQRIFEENNIVEVTFYQNGVELNHTGNFIEFSKNELDSRFDDAFVCILSGLKKI